MSRFDRLVERLELLVQKWRAENDARRERIQRIRYPLDMEIKPGRPSTSVALAWALRRRVLAPRVVGPNRATRRKKPAREVG